MPLVCCRCQRANPSEAVYCHFDGVVLVSPSGATLPPGTLPQEFVFPSGRRCKTYDELVQGCQYEWEDARTLLKRGEFGPFFARIGRLDLARAAREAQEQPDTDIALHELVAGLPATCIQGPRLDLQPRRLLIGPVPAGHDDEVRLIVVNQGKGLLQGKLSISEGGAWLHAGKNGNGDHVALKTARSQEVTLRVSTRGLVAPQSYGARLTVVSNGGVVEVPVRLDVAALPFGRPPFEEASNPRDLASRMRANPKAAVPFLESGEIASWFKTNGWTYPVPGATARGVAAVQQFFEHMGLSKPPPLTLSETGVRLEFGPRETASGTLTIRTVARKWVYAEVTSDAAWLRVTTPKVSGPQQATISFEVAGQQLSAGATREASLRIRGNAGQDLSARVTATVGAPRGTSRRAHTAETARSLSGRWRAFFIGCCSQSRQTSGPVARGMASRWLHPALSEEGFLRSFVLATWWIGAAAGVVAARRRGGKLINLFCGAIAGAFAGLAGAATVGCLVTLLDAGPRAVLAQLSPPATASVVAEFLWVALASSCWAVGGAVTGAILGVCGTAGQRVLSFLTAPAAWLIADRPTT